MVLVPLSISSIRIKIFSPALAASTIRSSGTDPGEVPANAPMAPGDEAPEGTPFTIRLKTPTGGEVTIHDRVQGAVTVKNEEIDDYIERFTSLMQQPVILH